MVDKNMWTKVQALKDYLDTNGYSGNKHVLATAPTKNEDKNDGYDKYDLVLDTSTDKVWEIIDTTAGAAVWRDTELTLGDVTEGGVEVYVAANQAAQLALDTRIGDIVIRLDSGKKYRKTAGAAGDMTDWTEIPSEGASVTNVADDAAAIALDAAAGDMIVKLDNGKVYYHNGGTEGDMTDWTAIPLAGDILANLLVAFLGDGLLSTPGLAIATIAPEKFQVANTTYARIANIQHSKSAEDEIVFTAADTINTGAAVGDFFGAWLVQMTAAGTVSTKPAGGLADQVYASEEEAVAALPDPDASNVALGYIAIGANTDSSWTANTDDMTAASDCASVTFADASLLARPSAV